MWTINKSIKKQQQRLKTILFHCIDRIFRWKTMHNKNIQFASVFFCLKTMFCIILNIIIVALKIHSSQPITETIGKKELWYEYFLLDFKLLFIFSLSHLYVIFTFPFFFLFHFGRNHFHFVFTLSIIECIRFSLPHPIKSINFHHFDFYFPLNPLERGK